MIKVGQPLISVNQLLAYSLYDTIIALGLDFALLQLVVHDMAMDKRKQRLWVLDRALVVRSNMLTKQYWPIFKALINFVLLLVVNCLYIITEM